MCSWARKVPKEPSWQFTRITREPASSALLSVIVMNRFQATSAMLFAR